MHHMVQSNQRQAENIEPRDKTTKAQSSSQSGRTSLLLEPQALRRDEAARRVPQDLGNLMMMTGGRTARVQATHLKMNSKVSSALQLNLRAQMLSPEPGS
ncbi:hypothetical protein PR001_g7348 [Phytophthora rubi]|uniref:Uncharacterized protein n=1 Tax=Phytophthora rubi TaxID=129364 RepID=A0A6A3N882_9STRA|nr:hypothetical protein PR001_g7348 [Phytophthora rubi]